MDFLHLFGSEITAMEQTLCYESTYTLQECIRQITKEPQQYTCNWGTPLRYRAQKISQTQVLITFTGGQFRKLMRTQYLMELLPQEKHTQITLRFQKELFGLPPMTHPSDIDRCMEQKINAVRKD